MMIINPMEYIREIPELKGSLKKAIAFLDTSYELLNKLEKPSIAQN
jgi:hypothetical protein